MRTPFLALMTTVLGAVSARAGDAEDLRSADAKTRLLAIGRLGKWKAKIDPALAPELVERLREDPEPQVRFAVAHALVNLKPTTKLVLAALVEVAHDPDEPIGIRGAALTTLGKVGNGSAKVADAVTAAAEEPQLTRQATQALVALGHETRAKALLSHANPKVREAATNAYLSSGAGGVIAVGLGSTEQAIRRKAAGDLTNRDFRRNPLTADEFALVAQYVRDADIEVRVDVIRALLKAGKSSAIIPDLLEGLGTAEEKVRFACAEALGSAGPGIAAHLPEVLKVLESEPDNRLKVHLVRVLGEAEAEAQLALPALFALMKDTDPSVQVAAIRALAKAGAANPAEASKQARPYLNHSRADVRDAADRVVVLWSAFDPADVAARLKDKSLAGAMKAVPLVYKLGTRATEVVPDLFAIAARVPLPRPGVVIGGEMGTLADALASMGPDVVPKLSEGLASPTLRVRQLSSDALVRLRIDAAPALPALRKATTDADRSVRVQSLRTLGFLGYRARAAVPDIINSFVKFEDSGGSAAESLCWIGATGDDAKRLLALVNEPYSKPYVRGHRYSALGGAGRDALPLIEELRKKLEPTDPLGRNLSESKWFVDRDLVLDSQLRGLKDQKEAKSPHEAAWGALRFELTADQRKIVTDGLLQMLESRPPEIQAHALRCLCWVGPEGAAARPAVEKLCNSPDEGVRRIAKQTLARLPK